MAAIFILSYRFNTQPPEGGWDGKDDPKPDDKPFQHAAARRRLAVVAIMAAVWGMFQHAAARRRLAVV